MKKILYILLILSVMGCKVKKVDVNKREEITEKVSEIDKKIDNATVIETKTVYTELSEKDIIEAIKNLNISYEGKEVSDKLDILLQKSEQGGTKMSFSGIGTATYNESYKRDIESLQTTLIKRQDSIFNQVLNEITKQNEELLKKYLEKTKAVKVTGFQFGFYLMVFGIVVVLAALAFIAKKFSWI